MSNQSKVVVTVHHSPQAPTNHTPLACPQHPIGEGVTNAQHITELVPTATRSGILQRYVGAGRPYWYLVTMNTNARAIHVQSQQLSQQQHLQLYMVQETATERAPTIIVQISSSTGTQDLNVLLDSGATSEM